MKKHAFIRTVSVPQHNLIDAMLTDEEGNSSDILICSMSVGSLIMAAL